MSTNRALKLAFLASILAAIGCGSSTDRLVAQLGDADPKVRRAAARILAEQANAEEQVIAVLTTASRNSDVEVREIAIAGLGAIGAPAKSSLPALIESLQDTESSVRVAAALAIQKIDPQSETFVPVLAESLRVGHGPVFLEVGKMGPNGKWAIPTLITLLDDRRPSIRALSAKTLAEIGSNDHRVEVALQRATRDKMPAVRNAAQNSLRVLQPQRADFPQ